MTTPAARASGALDAPHAATASVPGGVAAVRQASGAVAAVRNAAGQWVGPDLPGWQPPPQPPREPLAGRWCSLLPTDAARDAVALFDAARGAPPASWTYLPYGPFADAVAYGDWLAGVAAQDDPLFFTIHARVEAGAGSALHGGAAGAARGAVAAGQPLGVAAWMRIDRANGVIEIGHLYFSPRLQRTPAATEAISLLIDRAFQLGYRRVEWKCDALNEPSRRAALRLGFRFEGVFRQAVVVKGRSRDTAWFSIIDAEWPALRTTHQAWLHPDNFDAQGRQRSALSAHTRSPA